MPFRACVTVSRHFVVHAELLDLDHGFDRVGLALDPGAAHGLFDGLLRGHADLFEELPHGHVEIVAH